MVSGLAAGVHRIYLRTKNSKGLWSMTSISTFYIIPVNFTIPPRAPVGQITALEYFFDHDPGFGNGHMITIAPTTDPANYQLTADITGLKQDSMHTYLSGRLTGGPRPLLMPS